LKGLPSGLPCSPCNLCNPCLNRSRLNRLHDPRGHLVGVSGGVRATVLQPALPATLNGSDGDADGRTAIGNTEAELVDALGLVEAGEAEVVVVAIDLDVLLSDGAESFTDLIVVFFLTAFTEEGVGEVGVHTGTVPVSGDGLTFVVDHDTVLFSHTIEEEAGEPYLVTSFLSAFGEGLEFPLSGCNFAVDAFYGEACVKASIEVLFYDFAAVGQRICCMGSLPSSQTYCSLCLVAIMVNSYFCG